MKIRQIIAVLVLAVLVVFLVGCGASRSALPKDPENFYIYVEEEDNDKDPWDGMVVFKNSLAVDVFFYDKKALKPILKTKEDGSITTKEESYTEGLNGKITRANGEEIFPIGEIRDGGVIPNHWVDGKLKARIYLCRLKPGSYYVRIKPYCLKPKTGILVSLFNFGSETRDRVDVFDERWEELEINNTGRDYPDKKYTYERWGWEKIITTENVPKRYWWRKSKKETSKGRRKKVFWKRIDKRGDWEQI